MAKSFDIDKGLFLQAFKMVKANKGVHGVDWQSIVEFEKNLSNNLYRLWNRLSSGSYFPPAVRRVEIPKKDGTTRTLGIPTVGDRVIQTVVKLVLEPKLDRVFHEDSYGFRPGKSAHDAVGQARRRCFDYRWVLDIDIKNFFETIPHDLLMKAVRRHTSCPWILLSIERWIKAPIQLKDGSTIQRQAGTPQGGVISPLLANLFLHYGFDLWIDREVGNIPFERYADDIVCHCVSQRQAEWLQRKLSRRFLEIGLVLHPAKTQIVYCQSSFRKEKYRNVSFDFLGFSFRPRKVLCSNGKTVTGFLPGVSRNAQKKMRTTIKRWKFRQRNKLNLTELANEFNPIIRGWLNYYGKFYRSAMGVIKDYLDYHLVKWLRGKFKRFRCRPRAARRCLIKLALNNPGMFAHWRGS